MGKEIVVHEAVVTLRMVPRQSNIFILTFFFFSLDLLLRREESTYHVECNNIFEGYLASFVPLD